MAVVGASAAGLAAVEGLRRAGWDGLLTLVGDEPHPPYDRPPLSKQVLSGSWEPDRTGLRSAEQLAGLDLDLRLGTRAAALDAAARRLTLDDAERTVLDCAGIVVATGVRPRTLPGTEGVAGVYVLRSLEDALALRERLAAPGRRLAVVGDGVLGAEAAAVATGLGHRVVLIGSGTAPMGRVLGAETGALLAAVHRAHGVELRAGRASGVVTGPDPAGGPDGRHVTGVRLTDGGTVEADTVLVATGSVPAVDWLGPSGEAAATAVGTTDAAGTADAAAPGAEAAGAGARAVGGARLDLADGLGCDAHCAAAPGVYGAGDVARWYHPVLGRTLRIEHRMNATEQGLAAARNLLAELDAERFGAPRPFAPVPYFWSDQFGLKLQAYGVLEGADRIEVLCLEKDPLRLAALHGREGRATGVLGAGLPPRTVRGLRALVAGDAPADWDEALAAFRTAVQG
ncbi:FAD-dependent oxidoreductase [Streptomyces sp. NHF165]|nr:FAD-dependent oxidoreductase [Streptomyces sp. NHF165]